jgi:hypothetical protein
VPEVVTAKEVLCPPETLAQIKEPTCFGDE